MTSRDNIKTLKDLEGKEIAGARATTNYKMFEFFAKQQGVDVVQVQGGQHRDRRPRQLRHRRPRRRHPALGAGLHAAASRRSRASARSIWTSTRSGRSSPQASSRIPYLGVAAHADWVDAHPDLVKKLYATYKAAAEWTQKHPDEAAPLMFAEVDAGRPEGHRFADPRQ